VQSIAWKELSTKWPITCWMGRWTAAHLLISSTKYSVWIYQQSIETEN